MARIGFIGLGNMGLPMARNLLAAGHQVRGFDVNPLAAAALAEAGGQEADTPRAAVQGAEFALSMLPSGADVRDVWLGSGAADAAPPGAVLLDCSTIDVATARAVAGAVGRPMLDAPVSGGTMGAAAATLTFMVGGPLAAFDRAEPILRAMGRTIVRCGDAGAGQAAKVCNNMMLAISMIGTCEAFVLAERLGLSAHALFEVASRSSGQSWSLTTYCPVPGPVPASPANRGYTPGFAAALMLKDVLLAQQAARETGVVLPMGKLAEDLYRRFVEDGHAGLDFSAIITALRQGEMPPADPRSADR